jgi:creatinine amidohydrolase
MSEVSVGRLSFPQPVTVKLRAWWEGPRIQRLRQDLYGDREGFHVTPSEVAIVAALHPDRAPSPEGWPPFQPLPDDPLLEHGGDRHDDAERHAKRYPTGIVGSDPSLVRPDHGAVLLNAAVEDLAELWRGFIAAPDPAVQPGR